MLEKTPRSKGAKLETCPSGRLPEICLAVRHATGAGAARRSEVGALPLLDPYGLGDREVEQLDRCPGVVAQSRR